MLQTMISSLLILSFSMIHDKGLVFAFEKTFLQTNVSASAVSGALYGEVFSSRSVINCATRANSRGWSHLFCLEGTSCRVYSTLVKPLQDTDESDAMTCYTDVPKNTCIFNGKIYLEDAVAFANCQMWYCIDENMTAAGEVSKVTCPSGFTYIEKVGCIYISASGVTSVTEAINACSALSAHLVMENDLSYMREYVKDCHAGKYLWVGISNGKWMDGTDVGAAVWIPTYPRAPPGACGVLFPGSDHGARDVNCAGVPSTDYICQYP